ncbi:MAG: polyprenyl synthetase family protein [Desulfocapsaceae bacterium]|nr:polyprenyl synthetase family protein [Desulfocapsaceae bacterium]
MSQFTVSQASGLDLKEQIKPDIQRVEEAMRQDLDTASDRLDDLLLEVLRYGLFNGGKRFRPLLTILAARLCGGDVPDIHRLAIAFEYLHVATLFHDDVIDNADTRRGRPALNRVYGTVAAILAGDFLHARSMAIVGERAGLEALKIFCQATGGMVDGEFLQLRNAANYDLSEEGYFAAITGKTALLIAATTEIGSLAGGATQEQRHAMRGYGSNLGCAFQIIDDLLDYLGDQQITGKPVGNDLAEGKMTLPLILAMNRAGKEDRQRLLQILKDEGLRKKSAGTVTEIISKYNGFSDTKKRAEQMICQAIAPLAIFSRETQRKDRLILEGLAQYVLTRNK